ncbi:MAG TPA: nuclear transport factor 2 family protein [Planctomycetota bacterium]|nr:nuclear transport factor 2 family protein [Planctomycetota bacterium]
MTRAWALLVLVLTAPLAAAPQALPDAELREVAMPGVSEPLRYVVQLPAGYAPEQRHALLVLWPDGVGDVAAARAAVEQWGSEVARGGFVVVSPAVDEHEDALGSLFAQLRASFRIDQGGMHAGGSGLGAARAVRGVQRWAHEFQTATLWAVTAWDNPVGEVVAPLQRLHERRVRVLEMPSAVELRQHFVALHAERAEAGVAGDVARTLDDFHAAAANGDEVRYFAILPDDSVFLGTDATERWTGAEFRNFAMPYFERPSAWTYVPLRRHVTVAGGFAWFDEVLDNEAYGECRGSGVLELRGERWVLRQYNLTVPVPNDLMRGVTARIRAFAAGAAPAVTTVLVVRHAEKVDDSDDAELSDAGRARAADLARVLEDLPVTAAYTSPYRRAAATVAPLCAAKKIEATTTPAGDAKGLAARVRAEHLGETVLVCGHSNTVPAILKALGAAERVVVADDEYDRLFVVTIGPDGVRLLPLRYGAQ